MTGFQLTLLLTSIAAIWAALSYVDAKYNSRLVDWLSGECDRPFKSEKQSAKQNTSKDSTQHAKDAEITALKTRIETLEKIVTDNAYELNEQLRRLK